MHVLLLFLFLKPHNYRIKDMNFLLIISLSKKTHDGFFIKWGGWP